MGITGRIIPSTNDIKGNISRSTYNNAEIKEIKTEIEILDKKVDTKQDEIKFICVNSYEGTLNQEQLDLLKKNKVNRIVLNNVIYYLSAIDGNIRKYFSRIESTDHNEVDVNINTGYYLFISKMNPIIENHINDTTIHITEAERLYWNNKVSASAEENQDNDFTLLLHK